LTLSLLYLFPLEGITLLITLYIVSGLTRAIYNILTRKILNKKSIKEDV
jgi:hypothetical protein